MNEQDAISTVALRYYSCLLPTLLRSLTTNENEPLCEEDYRAVWVLIAVSELHGLIQDDFEIRMDALTVEAIADLAVENWERDIPAKYRIDREVVYYSSFDDLLEKEKEVYTANVKAQSERQKRYIAKMDKAYQDLRGNEDV